jgi:cytochrome c biogenesis protein CcmG/thiol:disulfide interchange protein DsbE
MNAIGARRSALADVDDADLVVIDDTAAGVARRRRVAPYVAGGVAVVVVALLAVLLAADKDPAETADSPLIGNLAPDSRGEFADGTPFELSRRKGSWVVLNFFTHNCVPCIREHPELIEFAEQQRAIGADGAELYTIVRDSSRRQVDEFFAERGGDWPIVYDPEYQFSNDFAVVQVPETWVIDPNGFVRSRQISQVTAEGLGALINQMKAAG